MSVVVAVPTFNEVENLESIVRRIRTVHPEVTTLIVDDGSTDGTREIADRLAAADDAIVVMHRTGERGLGRSYLDAFAWADENGYDVVVEMDADGSHRPEELHRLLDAIDDGADLVIGSRWVDGGEVVNWPRRRLLLSRGGNAYARWMLRLRTRDVTGGYRALRISALPRLDLEGVESHGYCFQVDITRRAAAAGLDIREVPIRFVERELGHSKMSGAIVREAMGRVTVWGLRARSRRRNVG